MGWSHGRRAYGDGVDEGLKGGSSDLDEDVVETSKSVLLGHRGDDDVGVLGDERVVEPDEIGVSTNDRVVLLLVVLVGGLGLDGVGDVGLDALTLSHGIDNLNDEFGLKKRRSEQKDLQSEEKSPGVNLRVAREFPGIA